MNKAEFQDWLDRYVEAWMTYDQGKIGALFSTDARYRYHPQAEPLIGRDAIVKDWLDNRDEEGTYEGRYEPLALDGEVHVATGVSRYFDGPGGALNDEYCNVYICRFNEAGECTDFTEYWMQNRRFRRESIERMIREAGGTPPPPASE
jgi:hypothetical protein